MSETAQPGGEIAAPAEGVGTPSGAEATTQSQSPAQPETEAAEGTAKATEPGAATEEQIPEWAKKRFDKLTAQRRDAERRERELFQQNRHLTEVLSKQLQAPPAANVAPGGVPPAIAARIGAPPNPADTARFPGGEFDPRYAAELAKYEMRAEQVQGELQRQQHTLQQQRVQKAQKWGAAVQEAAATYPDYDEVVLQNPHPLFQSGGFADAIAEIDDGAHVAYFLGKNAAEAQRIGSLPPVQAIAALGQISDRLKAQRQAASATKAPDPVKTLTGGGAASKDPLKMSHAEFRAHYAKNWAS